MTSPGPLPHVLTWGRAPRSPFLPWLSWEGSTRFLTGFSAAAVASPGLAVPEENPAPAHLRGLLPGHSGHF